MHPPAARIPGGCFALRWFFPAINPSKTTGIAEGNRGATSMYRLQSRAAPLWISEENLLLVTMLGGFPSGFVCSKLLVSSHPSASFACVSVP
ncbi:hypothetical protein Taro_024353 [Colocasia esculenta]|uniref:Uncharacterized protein n=1 Tax=Colocasia esculenta TaxID=4460 RepID=A0A843V760_COLES|nr:hypothetical protein [Colocasia esculenta]